jgi:hypothetical protein
MGVTQVLVPLLCHLSYFSMQNLKACVTFCWECKLIEVNVFYV